jgi:hypothetical protein
VAAKHFVRSNPRKMGLSGRALVNKWPSYTISMSEVNSQDDADLSAEERTEAL